jgi:hypothetical protein
MVTVRRASESDIPELVAVVNAAFQVERDFRLGDRTSPAEIARLMQNSTFFVAVKDERIAGAVLVRVNGATGYFGMLAVILRCSAPASDACCAKPLKTIAASTDARK